MSRAVYVFGRGHLGSLGLGKVFGAVDMPVRVPGLDSESIDWTSAGWNHTVAGCRSRGKAFLWGRPAHSEQAFALEKTYNFTPSLSLLLNHLGASRNAYLEPVEIPIANVDSAACGLHHTLLITDNGRKVVAFGRNNHGECGSAPFPQDAQVSDASAWQTVPLPSRAVSAAAGVNHSLVLCADGRVYSMGMERNGRLGIEQSGSNMDVRQPTAVRLVEPAQQVSAGLSHSAVLTQSGKVLVFGSHQAAEMKGSSPSDQLIQSRRWMKPSVAPQQTPADQELPREVPLARKAIAVSCGQKHTVILTEDQQLFAMGLNRHGQVRSSSSTAASGEGEAQFFVVPVSQGPLPWDVRADPIKKVLGAFYSTWILTDSGKLWVRDGDEFERMDGTEDLRVQDMACGWKHTVLVASEQSD